jgi:hypothetical protein
VKEVRTVRVESGDDVVVLQDAHDGHKNTIVVVIEKSKQK